MSDIKAKSDQIRFLLGLRWGSLQSSPDLLAVFNGPISKGRGMERKGKGIKVVKEKEEKGRSG